MTNVFAYFLSVFGLVAQSNYNFSNQFLPIDTVNTSAITWKVGDSASYVVSAGFFGRVGTMTKTVTAEDEMVDALWVTTDLNLSSTKDKTEVLISKQDGRILKFVRNGKEEQIPDAALEVVSQEYTEVTVPAGKFKAIHITANTSQVKGVQVWLNPRDTSMEGTLKQVVPSQFGNVTTEMTSFRRSGILRILPIYDLGSE
jgi:hypothetical protein